MLGVGLGAVLAALQRAPCTMVWCGRLLAAQCATGAYCRTAVLAVVSESWIPDSSPKCNVDEGDPTQASELRIKTNEFIKIDSDLKL